MKQPPYTRYGIEWEKEVMKNAKSTIVYMLRDVAKERDELVAAQPSVQADGLDSPADCVSDFDCGTLPCDACTHYIARR